MAEKRTIELEIQDNTKSLKAQYREAVQELQKVAAAYGETSTQAVNAAKKAAGLKDQIEDTNDLLQSFKGEGAFIAMGKAMSAVANGFSAVEGGLGLIGVESENVQATMLKVQSAMALAQGLEGLEDAGRAFKSLGTVIKSTSVYQLAYNFIQTGSIAESIKLTFAKTSETAATVAQGTATVAVTTATTGATMALKLYRAALISTGIGALIVGVGLLIANFDKLVGFVQKAVTWFSGLSGTMKNIISVIFPFIGLIRLVVAGLEELGIVDDEQAAIKKKNHENDMKRADAAIKKQEEMRKAREKAFNNEQSGYDRAIKLAQAEGKSVTDLQKAKINASIKYQETRKKELEQDLVAYKFAQKFLGELGESLIDTTDIEAKIAELGNNILDQKNDLKILDIEAKKPAAGTGVSASSSTSSATQKTDIDVTRRIEDERLRVMDESRAKELAALDLQYKRKKEDAEKELATDKDKLTKLAALNAQAVESKKVDEQRINDKYDKIDKDAATKAAEEKIRIQDEQWLALQKLKNSQQEQELLDLQLAYDKEYELAGTNAELQKALTDKFNKDSAAINKKYRTEEELAKDEANKKDAERIKALNDLRFKAAKDTLQVISNVTELFAGKSKAQQKRAFQIQKAVNIAGATMDTYKAASSALKDSPAPFNFIAMAAVITAGLLNVKKIASQKFEGGGASGGGGGASGGGGAAATMTPQFNVVGNNGINQLAQLQQQPVQAYVVSGEVTTAQSLDRNRVQNATL